MKSCKQKQARELLEHSWRVVEFYRDVFFAGGMAHFLREAGITVALVQRLNKYK